MSKWGVRVVRKQTRSLAIAKNGEFEFKTILGEKVVHENHKLYSRIMMEDTPRQRESCISLAKLFSNNTFFSQFTYDVLLHVLSYLEVDTYFKGQSIVTQGAYGKDVYVINSGSAVVQITPKDPRQRPFIVMSIPAGDGFGKLALLNDGFRAASVIANERGTEVLKIPEICVQVLRNYWNKFHSDTGDFLMLKMPPEISEVLERDKVNRLVEKMHVATFKRGNVIVAEGVNAKVRKLYWIKTGSCRLLKKCPGPDGQMHFGELQHLQPAAVFGYTSLDYKSVPQFSVVANSEVQCIVAATSDFNNIMNHTAAKAISNYLHSLDIDPTELTSTLFTKMAWRDWKNNFLDVVHVKETLQKTSIVPDEMFREVGALKRLNQEENPAVPVERSKYLKQLGYEFKEHKKKPKRKNTRAHAITSKVKKFSQRNGLKVQRYKHVSHDQIISAPSASKLIHHSLSEQFLGKGHNQKEEDMTEEEREQHYLEVIEKLGQPIAATPEETPAEIRLSKSKSLSSLSPTKNSSNDVLPVLLNTRSRVTYKRVHKSFADRKPRAVTSMTPRNFSKAKISPSQKRKPVRLNPVSPVSSHRPDKFNALRLLDGILE